MAANRDIRDFFELRAGFQGMYDFCDAALAFLDRQGIAPRKMVKPRYNGEANGNGHHKDIESLRAAAKARYAARPSVHEPDGRHITIEEAANILGLTDSGTRIRVKTGRLPAARYEWRTDKDGRRAKKQVIPRDAVEQMAATEGRGKKAGRKSKKVRKAKGQTTSDEPLPTLAKGSLKGLKGYEAIIKALSQLDRKPVRAIHLGNAMKRAGYKGSITSVGVLLPTLAKKDRITRTDEGMYQLKDA